MENIPIAIPINKAPDIDEKVMYNQVSGIEMKIGDAIMEYLGLAVIRQLLIYNPSYPTHPFEIDIYVPEKDLALDVDGKSHKTDKVKARQLRKDKAVKGLTGISEYHHIDVSTPPELLYWNKKGKNREYTKNLYDTYSEGLIFQAIKIVQYAKFRPTLQTPQVLKSQEMYQRGQDRLQELLKK